MEPRSTRRRALLSVLALLPLSGCYDSPDPNDLNSWTQFGFDAANTGYNPRGAGPESDPSVEDHDAESTLAPLPVAPYLYVAGDGGVTTFEDGWKRWTVPIGSVEAAPAFGDALYAPVDGSLVAVSPDGGFEFFGYRTGFVEWTHSTPDPLVSPVTTDGDAFVGGRGAAYRIATDGSRRWRRSLDGVVETAPAVDDDRVYVTVGSDDGGAIVALDRATGSTEWRFPVGRFPTAAPAVADGVVYVGTDTATCYALDGADGSIVWSRNLGVVRASPIVAEDSIVVPTYDGTAYALDASTGGTEWGRALDGRIEHAPAAAGSTRYVATESRIVALDGADGAVAWSCALDSSPASALVVADGTLYAATEEETVIVVEPVVTLR